MSWSCRCFRWPPRLKRVGIILRRIAGLDRHPDIAKLARRGWLADPVANAGDPFLAGIVGLQHDRAHAAMTDDETNGNGGGNEERIDLVRSMKAVPAP